MCWYYENHFKHFPLWFSWEDQIFQKLSILKFHIRFYFSYTLWIRQLKLYIEIKTNVFYIRHMTMHLVSWKLRFPFVLRLQLFLQLWESFIKSFHFLAMRWFTKYPLYPAWASITSCSKFSHKFSAMFRILIELGGWNG